MFKTNFNELIIKNYSPINAKGGKRMRRRSYRKKSRRNKTNKSRTRRRHS